MIIVIPMAGRGERFLKAGFRLPKPLIPVDGNPMFVKAVNSLPLGMATLLVFVVLEEHIKNYQIDRIIRDMYGHFPLRIIALKQVTSGQGESVYLAIKNLDENMPILIYNTDSAFIDDLAVYLPNLDKNISGVIQFFYDIEPRWSFVRCNANYHVLEAVEKKTISNMASTGLYYFRSLRLYKDACEQIRGRIGETYIAPMYNYIIAQGGLVLAKPVDKYFCFGTPQDYDKYLLGGGRYSGRIAQDKLQ